MTKQFFAWGQTISGTNYFYTRDHLGSVRDVTDSTGTVQAHFEYGMYGEVTQTVGTLASDFQYTGLYYHAPSGLNLATFRAYNPTLGRWINRDPMKGAERSQGPNLYAYVGNMPTENIDPSGLVWRPGINCVGYACGATGPNQSLQPGPGESLSSIIEGEGFTCRKLRPWASASDCTCGKNQDKIFIVLKGPDAFNAPGYAGYGGSSNAGPDYHAYREDSPGRWSAEVGQNGLNNQNPWSGSTGDVDADANANNYIAAGRYCCCRCK